MITMILLMYQGMYNYPAQLQIVQPSFAMGYVPTFQLLKISAKDIEAKRMTLNIMQTEQKVALVNGERKREVEDV